MGTKPKPMVVPFQQKAQGPKAPPAPAGNTDEDDIRHAIILERLRRGFLPTPEEREILFEHDRREGRPRPRVSTNPDSYKRPDYDAIIRGDN